MHCLPYAQVFHHHGFIFLPKYATIEYNRGGSFLSHRFLLEFLRMKETILVLGSDTLVGYHLTPSLMASSFGKFALDIDVLPIELTLDFSANFPSWRCSTTTRLYLDALRRRGTRVLAIIDVDTWYTTLPRFAPSACVKTSRRERFARYGRERAKRLISLCEEFGAKLVSLVHPSSLGFPYPIPSLPQLGYFLPSLFVPGTTLGSSGCCSYSSSLLLPEAVFAYEAAIHIAINSGFQGVTIVSPSVVAPVNPHKSALRSHTGIRFLDAAPLLFALYPTDRPLILVDARDLSKGVAKATFSPFITGRFLLDGEKTSLVKALTSLGVEPSLLPSSLEFMDEVSSEETTPESLLSPLIYYTAQFMRILGIRHEVTELLWETMGIPFNAERAVSELGFKRRPLAQTLSDTKRSLPTDILPKNKLI